MLGLCTPWLPSGVLIEYPLEYPCPIFTVDLLTNNGRWLWGKIWGIKNSCFRLSSTVNKLFSAFTPVHRRYSKSGETTAIRRTGFRETGLSRHRGDLPKTPRTSLHYAIEVFKRCPQLGAHYAERCDRETDEATFSSQVTEHSLQATMTQLS